MMDKNDIDAATRNRERIKHLQTREKKEEIVDRYQKGDKTASIQEDYDIGPGELYPILHKAGVPLRSKNPPIIPEKVTPPPPAKITLIPVNPTIPTSHFEKKETKVPKPKDENSDVWLMTDALDRLTERPDKTDTRIKSVFDAIKALGPGQMDENLKTDIIHAFIHCGLWPERDTAKKILAVIQNVEGL